MLSWLRGVLHCRERILGYRDESQRLDQSSRLYDSSVSNDGFEQDASRIVQVGFQRIVILLLFDVFQCVILVVSTSDLYRSRFCFFMLCKTMQLL